MRIDVLSIFPGAVERFCDESLLGKARERGILDLRVHDLRDGTDDVHRSVDDSPFGGGAGMVIKAEPVMRTIAAAESPRPVIYLGPAGERFDQPMADELAALDGFTLLCGRYEGIDQRVLDTAVDREISIGDVVLNGGEVAALVVIEAVGRLLPGMVGNDESVRTESFADGLLEHPHYTRPARWRGIDVPEVLLSGDHARVERWRAAQSLHRSIARRPDLIDARGGLSDAERALLGEFPVEPPAQMGPDPT